MELTISLGAVSPPGNTVAYGTTVEINGIQIITYNGANSNTSGIDGGNGATLFENVFCSYSCGGGGGMNSNGGGGTSGSSGSGSTSFFDGSALAEWGSGNSGNGGLNNNGAPGAGGGVLGITFLSSNTSGCLGCVGCGGYGTGSGGNLIPPGNGGGGYVKALLR